MATTVTGTMATPLEKVKMSAANENDSESVQYNAEGSSSCQDCPRAGQESRASFQALIRPDLEHYCGASNLAFNEKIQTIMKQGRKVYHFGFGQSPFPVYEVMVQALREYASESAYLPVAGIPELREGVIKFHEHYDRLSHFQPDQVLIGPGSKELIFLAMNVFHGDVMVVSPSWTTYKPQSQLAHHKPYTVEAAMENDWRITPEAIEKTIADNKLNRNKLLVLCSPDNPTGTSYRIEHLQALSAVCRKHNIIVISDEIYARLYYEQNHDTLARYYPEGTIISSGFSKWSSAGGWRLGYHLYPRELDALKEAVKSAGSHTYSCAPAPMQYAVAKGLKDEEACHSYILHTSRIMSTVAKYCTRELQSVGVKVTHSTAGFYIFPNYEVLREPLRRRGIITCEQMCEALLEETNVALMAGGPAFFRPVDELATKLCYVPFDGKHSLEASRSLVLDSPLPADFVQTHVLPVYEGIQALKNWIALQVATYK